MGKNGIKLISKEIERWRCESVRIFLIILLFAFICLVIDRIVFLLELFCYFL